MDCEMPKCNGSFFSNYEIYFKGFEATLIIKDIIRTK